MNSIPDKIMTRLVYNECHMTSLESVLNVALANNKPELLVKTLRELVYRAFYRENEYHVEQAKEVLSLHKVMQEAREIIKE